MNENNELVISEQLTPQPELQIANGKPQPPADAKQLRTEAVGALLSGAYAGASTLKLKPNEIKDLTEDFPDDAIEIRPFDGIIYISHMLLRERLWKVFGPTEVAEICRERFIRSDSNEIAVDLVLMARGKFLAEGVGTAKYFPNNPKGSFGDTVESAWSEALRRCCKKIGCGTAVWRPDFVRRWLADNAVKQGGAWLRKDDPRIAPVTGKKTRDYTLKDEKPVSEFQKMKDAIQAVPEVDENGVPSSDPYHNTYECPECSDDVSVPLPMAKYVTCPSCKSKLEIMVDADFENGMWHDRTELALVDPEREHMKKMLKHLTRDGD